MKRRDDRREKQSGGSLRPRSRRSAETPDGDRHPISRLHRTVGNQAVQAMAESASGRLGGAGRQAGDGPVGGGSARAGAAGPTVVQRKPDGGSGGSGQGGGKSVEGRVESATGVDTAAHSVGANVVLSGNQVLSSNADRTIQTTDATTVDVGVTERAVRFRFEPGLYIESHYPYAPDPNIYVHSLTWNYNEQSFSVDYSSVRAVQYISDPGAMIISSVGESLKKNLPARMHEKGYNPYEDPKLPGELTKIVQNLSSSPPATESASFEASLMVSEQVRRPMGDLELTLPSGTVANARVELQGGLPQSPSGTRVSELSLSFSGAGRNGAELSLAGSDLGEDLPLLFLDSVTVHRGGGITMDYVLATEVTEAGLKAVRALMQRTAAGRMAAAENANFERHPKLREKVNSVVDEKLEPMLRELVLNSNDQIPNVDLAKVLGVSK